MGKESSAEEGAMMRKKRSIGVTVFAIIILLMGCYRLFLGAIVRNLEVRKLMDTVEWGAHLTNILEKDGIEINRSQKEQFFTILNSEMRKSPIKNQLWIQPFLYLSIALGFLSVSIGVFKLKNWSLYGLTFFCLLDVLRKSVLLFIFANAIKQSIVALLEYYPSGIATTILMFWIYHAIPTITVFIFFLLALFFFTRPKVKEQFH